MPHTHTNPSRFHYHRVWITHASPALFVKNLVLHNAFDYSVGIVARHVNHNVFWAKLLNGGNVGTVEKMSVNTNWKQWKLTYTRCCRIPSLSTDRITVGWRQRGYGTGGGHDDMVHH